MIELVQDLWHIDADAICITTNGFVKQNGECVMGRGCAQEAKDVFPGIALQLGTQIRRNGNIVQIIPRAEWLQAVIAFPVKHHWAQPADLALIERSTKQLLALANGPHKNWKRIVLPRPGCGNGQLSWDTVKPILEGWLDERFIVVTKGAP